MVDLSTTYLGLELRSPIVASASPITDDPDVVRRLEGAGAAAVVLPSLFEEEILHEEIELNRALEAGSEHVAEALDYFPTIEELPHAGDRYVARLARIKAATSLPVIASLNATSPGGWTDHARRLQDAGADALELNLYHLSADPRLAADDVEDRDLEIIAAVRDEIDIPLAVKLSPYYSAMAGFAQDVVRAGADGLVLFNRFYQPDLDLESLAVVPRVELSSPSELRLPLRWIAILSPHLRGRASLAATSGVASGSDVVKALLVGADVAMTTSALLRHGPEHVAVLESELLAWLTEREYHSVAQLRGSANRSTSGDPAAFERAGYVRTLHSWAGRHDRSPSSS
ncbi:MAG: dihydroorotate dehydrogenase-like protein [Acidimicrobiia bacterium]